MYNEEPVIAQVLAGIKRSGKYLIIVVDDGSTDSTYQAAKSQKVLVLRHILNRGKGAAIKTGIEAAIMLGATIVVTMDGDGQHSPIDIKRLIKKIKSGYDVVLGTRNLDSQTMPPVRIVANHIGNFVTWLLYGIWVLDSQCGMRAYSKKAFSVINTKNERYEFDSEVIREIAEHKLRFTDIPVTVSYNRYVLEKPQKQSLLNGVRTLYNMILSA